MTPAAAMVPRRLLMIAYHYPPAVGSGVQRTLSFSRYLGDFGWQPVVLSAHPRAYPQTAADQLNRLPRNVSVARAFALDSARHLALRGRYGLWSALPDPWVSWLLGAVPLGLRLIRRHRPAVLWTTYPIATAHLIGAALHLLTGLPWVADFRDPMIEVDIRGRRFPSDRRVWRAREWIEGLTVRYAATTTFVAPSARARYVERHPRLDATRTSLIPNGFDEEDFIAAERLVATRPAPRRQQRLLVHSGILYPDSDRDPAAFLAALARLRDSKRISKESLRVVLRASGYEQRYNAAIHHHELQDMVFLEPSISHVEALAEMLTADGLLLFQGFTSNEAIPAKLYEYLRAQRPIFAMVHEAGDTAHLLREIAVGTLAPLDESDTIAQALDRFLQMVQRGTAAVARPGEIARHSRERQAATLARLFDTVAGAHTSPSSIQDETAPTAQAGRPR